MLPFLVHRNPKEEDPANQPSSVKRDLNYKTKMLKIQLSSLHSHPGHCKIEVSRGLVLEVPLGVDLLIMIHCGSCTSSYYVCVADRTVSFYMC